MKMLTNVLIKLIRGGFTDRVLYIDNVPEDMFYEMRHPRIVKGEGSQQAWVPDMSQPQVPTLYEELKRSQTGDNGIVFDMDNEQSSQRYKQLDRYLKSVYPNTKLPAEPVVNSTDPMNSAAPALQLSQIPRLVLPSLSPSEPKPSEVGSTTSSLDVDAIKREAVEQYKEQQREEAKERMAKARAAKEPAKAE